MYKKPAAPLSIGRVLDDAIKLYTASFANIWPISLLGSILLGASGFYTASVLRAVQLPAGGSQDAAAMLRRLSTLFSGTSMLLNLVTYLAWFLIYGALLAQMNRIAKGERPAVGAALGVSLRRMLGCVLATIVFGFAVIVGTVFFIVPGIYLWGKLQFWFTAAFADEVGAIEGLGRSWNITTGNWWRSSTILSVAMVIYFVLSIVHIMVAIGLSGAAVGLYHANVGGILVLVELVQAVGSVFTLPMVPAALLAIYYDMELRRNGTDLIARANLLQTA